MKRTLDPAAVRYGEDGLVVAIAQDAADGEVLMVAWQDEEALGATLRTGEAHFHSRSRGRLWKKGETSGNVLRVVDTSLDCDGDAVLMTVRPTGPACHTGARSCFDADDGADADARPQGFGWLEQLWATIDERARTRPEGSYTTRLLEGGVNAVSRKVAEEATEVVLAAKDADPEALAGEVADLLYHTLVLCRERGLEPSAVVAVLRERARR
jgi:phosphoribosyl-ATP pyrophosphohydrolase/phosphoribosyl-AMP cyclohydrolase